MPTRRSALRLSSAIAALGIVSTLVGCGGTPAAPSRKTAPVSGRVTFQTKPLANAKVFFFNDKFSTYGMTDAEGRYRLPEGAMAGTNKVFVTKVTEGEAAVPAGIANDPGQIAAAGAAAQTEGGRPKKGGPTEVLPLDVSTPEQTRLTFDVPEAGTDKADFSL